MITAFREEVEKSKKPGYKPPKYEDMEDIDYDDFREDLESEKSDT